MILTRLSSVSIATSTTGMTQQAEWAGTELRRDMVVEAPTHCQAPGAMATLQPQATATLQLRVTVKPALLAMTLPLVVVTGLKLQERRAMILVLASATVVQVQQLELTIPQALPRAVAMPAEPLDLTILTCKCHSSTQADNL